MPVPEMPIVRCKTREPSDVQPPGEGWLLVLLAASLPTLFGMPHHSTTGDSHAQQTEVQGVGLRGLSARTKEPSTDHPGRNLSWQRCCGGPYWNSANGDLACTSKHTHAPRVASLHRMPGMAAERKFQTMGFSEHSTGGALQSLRVPHLCRVREAAFRKGATSASTASTRKGTRNRRQRHLPWPTGPLVLREKALSSAMP